MPEITSGTIRNRDLRKSMILSTMRETQSDSPAFYVRFQMLVTHTYKTYTHVRPSIISYDTDVNTIRHA